jgi:hypothetical protein
VNDLGAAQFSSSCAELHPLLDWISENNDLLNLIANWAMVAIWVVYLQVFLRSFRRQTMPKIVINRAAGSSLGAACFVSNMSSEAIYLESVLVEIECAGEKFSTTVTDFEFQEGEEINADPKLRTYQGTLSPSHYTSLGSFEYLIATAARRTRHDLGLLQSTNCIFVQITIVADYASETLLVGARRKFRATWKSDHWCLTSETPETHQIRSKRERKRIFALLAEWE